MPTRLPHCASASARLTATVVLPTPPLPAPTAMTFFTPGSGGCPVSGADADRTLRGHLHVDVGHAGQRAHGGGRLIAHLVLDRTGRRRQLDGERRRGRSSIARSLTKPSETMSLRRSGSTTTRSALRTASRSGVGAWSISSTGLVERCCAARTAGGPRWSGAPRARRCRARCRTAARAG